MSSRLLSWTRRPRPALAALALLVLACATARAFRLNPGEDPARYRIVCRDSTRQCERLAREHCEGEYTVLNREMTRPEQQEVDESDLSSTGPSEGFVGWRSEMVVKCGRELPELRLVRPEQEEGSSVASAARTASAPSRANARERWCIPGATQACLGPGACSGAQACLRDGSGYGPCDCGTTSFASASSSTAIPLAPRTTPSGSAQGAGSAASQP
jgi:hypothetical protein